jgi:glutamate synthase (NADPH/NADH) large chain
VVTVRPHPDAPAEPTGGAGAGGGSGAGGGAGAGGAADAAGQVIAGNTIGYGATSGALYLRGVVGERFAVRNSGALMVCEGTGDHACEYMTGGRAVILGATGRNVAAGMSGGVAFLLDADAAMVNTDMVDLAGPDEGETDWLAGVLRDHADRTGSTIAATLLADWPTAAGRFTRVLPRDYARVLRVQQLAAESGADPARTDELIMEAVRG